MEDKSKIKYYEKFKSEEEDIPEEDPSKASKIAESYLHFTENNNSLRDLPCSINPQIKQEITNLCEETNMKDVSTKLNIPIQILEEWSLEIKEKGMERMSSEHKKLINTLQRPQKVEILAEVAIYGINQVSIKYGILVPSIRMWEAKIRTTGVETFINKKHCNHSTNQKFTVDEKIHILEEYASAGKKKSRVANKYDVSSRTLDVWKGKLNFFGREGLEFMKENGKRSKIDFTQEFKLEAVDYYIKNGCLKGTVEKYGCTSSCLLAWKRQIMDMGAEAFLERKLGLNGRPINTPEGYRKQELGYGDGDFGTIGTTINTNNNNTNNNNISAEEERDILVELGLFKSKDDVPDIESMGDIDMGDIDTKLEPKNPENKDKNLNIVCLPNIQQPSTTPPLKQNLNIIQNITTLNDFHILGKRSSASTEEDNEKGSTMDDVNIGADTCHVEVPGNYFGHLKYLLGDAREVFPLVIQFNESLFRSIN